MKLAHLFESTPHMLLEVKARIEHPEDLIWDSGGAGVTQALQILQTSAQRPEQVSIKWDGTPALVAGWRDGAFMLTDKAGFSAKGYDGLTTSQQDLERMILNRKIKLDTPEAKAARQSYAHKIASLYPLLKQVIPASLKGYVQGDLLWTQTPDIKQGVYVFKPNKISYAVPVNSELGKQIGASKVGIVFHSKLESPADDDADALRDPAALGIQSTPDVVVVPHEMQFKTPFKLNAELVKKVEQLVHAHGVQIDQLLDAAQLADRQIKALPQVMKAYLAHKAGEGATDLSDAAEDFVKFIQSAKSKLSVKAQQNISAWIESHVTAYRVVWQIVQLLVQIKLDLKHQMDVNVGDKIKAQLGDAPGHEGFVSVTDAGIIKLVNRAQFMKKDAPITEAIVSVSDTPRRAVFTFMRANPPTLGHRMVVDKVKQVAGNDDYWVFLSHSQDAKKNPLTWNQKVQFVKHIMKPHAAHVVTDADVKTPLQAANWLYDQGYTDITLVVGSDRVQAMTDLMTGWNSDAIRTKDGRDAVQLQVMSAGERDPDAEGLAGISGTKARDAVKQNDLAAFQAATGLQGDLAGKLFTSVKQGMQVKQAVKAVTETEQLQEVAPLIGMVLGAAGRALVAAAPRIVPNVGKALGAMARNPVKTTVGGAAIANPQDTADIVRGAADTARTAGQAARSTMDAVTSTNNFIRDTSAAAAQAQQDVYNRVEDAVAGITAMTKGALQSAAITSLAQLAVQYALPVAAVVAMLYGGKKLYDYFTENPPEKLQKEVEKKLEEAYSSKNYISIGKSLSSPARVRGAGAASLSTTLLEDEQHPHGTIVKLMMSANSAKQLHEWCKQHNIECMDPVYLHSTLIYSLKPAPQLVALHDTNTRMVARIKGWEMLGDNVLTLKLDCPMMNQMHEKFKQQGATHTYPNFIPHTTVMWNWNKPIPAELPDMQLVYDKLTITGIKPRAG